MRGCDDSIDPIQALWAFSRNLAIGPWWPITPATSPGCDLPSPRIRRERTCQKKYRALQKRCVSYKRRYRSKLEECSTLVEANTRMQGEIDALKTQLAQRGRTFTPGPLLVRCQLF